MFQPRYYKVHTVTMVFNAQLNIPSLYNKQSTNINRHFQ